METFEIVCGSCNTPNRVMPGQAGGRLTCRACGAECPVPRLGELRRLAATAASGLAGEGLAEGRPASGASSRRWSVAHGCVLAGAVLGIFGAGAASWFGDGMTRPVVDETGIRALVQASDLRTVLQAWRDLERKGLERPPASQERRQQAAASISRLLWLCSGAGAVLATGGGLAIVAARRRPDAAAIGGADRAAPAS